MRLDRLPTGGRVYVDANICIYHFTGVSPQCTAFLARCERGELSAVTGAHVLAEVAHRLMAVEAVRRGLVTSGSVAAKLRTQPAVVRRLTTYQEDLDALVAIGIEVMPLDGDVLAASAAIRREHGLLVNDSLCVAQIQRATIQALASSDQDFSRVPGLRVYRPADLPAALAAGRS
jgi:predicted nucleic acid-binding protein